MPSIPLLRRMCRMSGTKLSLTILMPTCRSLPHSTISANAGSMRTRVRSSNSRSRDTRMFSTCSRRQSRAGRCPCSQAFSQSRHASFGEYLSISWSRMSPSMSVLSKSKNNTGLSSDLGMRPLRLWRLAPRQGERAAEFLQMVRHRRSLQIGGHQVVGLLEKQQLAARGADMLDDELRIPRAGHVVVLRLNDEERAGHTRQRSLAHLDQVPHLAKQAHRKMRIAELGGTTAVAQARFAVPRRDLAAQGLVLQPERLVLAKIGEVFERRVVDQRDQPVVPGHAPAVVEQRRREAGHARDVIRELGRQHQ